MSSNDELDVAVAEALGWQWWHFPSAALVTHQLVAPGYDWPSMRWGAFPCVRPPEWKDKLDGVPDYSRDMRAAIGLLDGQQWAMHTCGDAYECCIYKLPGTVWIAAGPTPAEAICRAFLEMKKGKGS